MKTSVFVICAWTTCLAIEGWAMPTKEETEKATPAVQMLLKTERDALESGKKTRTQVADAAMKLATAADSEAAKMLLMKGAVALYVRDGNLEKAVATMNSLEAAISDMPSQCITNIIEWALLGVPKKNGVRFYRLLDESRRGEETPPPLKDASSQGEGVSSARQIQEPRDSIKSILNGMIKVPGRDYWLSSTELTQGQWEAVMGYNLSQHKGVNLPVDCVSREDCDVFLEKLNRSAAAQLASFIFYLPSLGEWKFAAQAGCPGSNCWIRAGVVGDVLDMAWTKENSSNETHVVATKPPNAFGFYDMLGNVWEWMSGCNVDRNKPGDSVGCRHGGSYSDVAADCSVYKGYHTERNYRRENFGLRLAARVRSSGEEAKEPTAVPAGAPRQGGSIIDRLRRREPKGL